MQAGLEIDTIEDTVFCYCDTMCCELCYLSFINANFVQNITTVKKYRLKLAAQLMLVCLSF